MLNENTKLTKRDVFKQFFDYDGGSLEIIKTFSVAHLGWECDSSGFVAQDSNGQKYIILTTHGSPYIADIADLECLINTYKNWIDETQEAINLVKS